MNTREVLEIVALKQMAIDSIPKAMNSIEHYHLEGMETALSLVLLMVSDPDAYPAEKRRCFWRLAEPEG